MPRRQRQQQREARRGPRARRSSARTLTAMAHLELATEQSRARLAAEQAPRTEAQRRAEALGRVHGARAGAWTFQAVEAVLSGAATEPPEPGEPWGDEPPAGVHSDDLDAYVEAFEAAFWAEQARRAVALV